MINCRKRICKVLEGLKMSKTAQQGDNRTQEDYLRYLAAFREHPIRAKAFDEYPLDLVPMNFLASQGYFRDLKGRLPADKDFMSDAGEMRRQNVIRNLSPLKSGFYLFAPNSIDFPFPRDLPQDEKKYALGLGFASDCMRESYYMPRHRIIYSPQFNGKMSKSILGHEIGHSRQDLEAFPNRNNTDRFEVRSKMNDSVESLTNGVAKTDRLKCEEDAWDRSPGAYDPEIRSRALGTYYGAVADAWRESALDALSDPFGEYKLPSAQKYYDNYCNFPNEGGSYKPDPDVAEFWRTNSVPQAYQYLKKLPSTTNTNGLRIRTM